MRNGGKNNSPPEKGLSRRKFLKGMGTGLVGTATLTQGLLAKEKEDKTPLATAASREITKAVVSLTINGKPYTAEVEPRETLLYLIREKLGLTGTKAVCERGECGACTVILNGKTVYSCMMLAVQAHGARITTIEGLSAGGKLHPVQEAFIKHDAYQCGFCTPGFEIALKDLLDKNPKASLDQIKEGLSGNLCRCGAYSHIFNAALELAGGKGGK
ncbi:MAG TPA: (2Fe-2S)-binding protein [archaeon]|nr:(2Fe-2S)-binding protein [archaeon]